MAVDFMLPDIEFIPVPDRVLSEMLRIAEVGPEDVVYDLGCGDGRIVMRALLAGAKRGIGIDVDPACVAAARVEAGRAGVLERAEFREEDLFATDLAEASVIMLYLLDSLNVRLRPRILEQCRPGTRVVSYSFEMGDWECDTHTPMAANGVSLWMVPANVSGRWSVLDAGSEAGLRGLEIQQRYQRISGTVNVFGEVASIDQGVVKGRDVSAMVRGGRRSWQLKGWVDGGRMSGRLIGEDEEMGWAVRRVGERGD